MQNGEKELYNIYLRISRTEQNKPFRYRKNFDKFEDHTDYPYLKKLYMFFRKFPHIKKEEFFRAPYRVYDDNSEYYEIKFYTTPRAIKLYKMYNDQMEQQDIDSEEQWAACKGSIGFIYSFCRDNKLTFEEYIHHTTGDVRTVLLHLRDRQIVPWSVYAIADLGDALKEYDKDFVEFTCGKNYLEKVDLWRSRYYNSTKTRLLCERSINNLRNTLTKN
jgi:hypothetical protein